MPPCDLDNWPAIKAVLKANHVKSKEIARMQVEYQKMHAIASKYCRRAFQRAAPSPRAVPPSTDASSILDNSPVPKRTITELECPSPSNDAFFPTEVFSSDEEIFASFSYV